MLPTGPAIQHVGDAQHKRDRDLEQRDHAESGRDVVVRIVSMNAATASSSRSRRRRAKWR